MQIVIDITDSDKEIIDNGFKSSEVSVNFYRRLIMAIQQGTPLPKGHGDLIDRNMCLAMKSRDLVDADGVTMYAVPTGNILRIDAVIPSDKETENG